MSGVERVDTEVIEDARRPMADPLRKTPDEWPWRPPTLSTHPLAERRPMVASVREPPSNASAISLFLAASTRAARAMTSGSPGYSSSPVITTVTLILRRPFMSRSRRLAPGSTLKGWLAPRNGVETVIAERSAAECAPPAEPAQGDSDRGVVVPLPLVPNLGMPTSG